MLRCFPQIAIAYALMGAVSSAHADHLDWNATAAGSVATTDNKNGSPTGRRSPGLFSDVRPGLLLTYNSRRHVHELMGEVALLYQLGADKPNATVRGGWHGFFITGPRSEASVSADAAIGQLNALAASLPSDQNSPLVQPSGSVDTEQLASVASFSWRATKFSRVFDRIFARQTNTFGGVVAYSDVWGRATLSARRQVTPNLLIAQNTISDGTQVTFAMPLDFLDDSGSSRQPKVVGLGTVAFDRTQLIDPEVGASRGQFYVARIDLSVAWQLRKGQTLGMRHEFSYQNGDQVGDRIILSFFRNTFYFTFALCFPEDVQLRVPRRGQSVRADQGDLAPIGAEPVVVDPAELLEGDGR